MLGFSTAAWKLAPRDSFIGWTRQLREKNLPFVVDAPVGFLITALDQDPQPGFAILALIRRRLPDDWTERYNTTPVLIRLSETPRYTGAVYRASGWIRVGTTQGRGRFRQAEKGCLAPAPATGLETAQSLKCDRGG